GLALFFSAMVRGMISLVTPITALVSASVPAIVGMVRGEALTQAQLGGMILALVAVTIISRPLGSDAAGESRPAGDGRRQRAGSRPVLGLSVMAGLGFAGFFLAMDNAELAGGDLWWPIVAARTIGSVLVLAALLFVRTIPRAPLPVVPFLLIAALGDAGGIIFFNVAIASGPLSLAAVLSSMYPVATVLLAWTVLHERLGRGHLLAVVLALVGVVLIAL
ncbi:MAG: EamA family transporter, partial [Chloroflexi bacterium]|nr:EamA family transporter [Chloroflexota bacterium]